MKSKHLQKTVLLIVGTDSTCVKTEMKSDALPKRDVKNPVPNSDFYF